MKNLKGIISKKAVLWIPFLLIFAAAWTLPNSSMAAVTVYAEGAYNQTQLVVYVYADINSEALCSSGVKVNFDGSKLTVASAEKNADTWYMGDGTNNNNYTDPIVQDGSVIILCGKLDTNDPTAGVTGNRVPLGKIVFTRTDDGTPAYPNQESYFGISLELGKPSPFANFVDTDGTDRDSAVEFSGVTIREFGDANADGNVTPADMLAIRNEYYGGTIAACEAAADCNNDSTTVKPHVTPADMLCVRNKYYSNPS